MKIQCDVCNKDEASSFCPADDAALCTKCDHHVHHANTVAGRHPRVSLLLPPSSPICDICQDQKALMFCQQDRAILCKDCDLAIHKVNEFTRNHSRFVLTGVMISPVAVQLPSTAGHGGDPRKSSVRDQEQGCAKQMSIAPEVNQTVPESRETSSISEYLIEMLPGWHVEDFLNHSPPTFSKVSEDDSLQFWDDELLKGNMNDCFSPETTANWVPQAPPSAIPSLPMAPSSQSFLHNPYKQQSFPNVDFESQIISGSGPSNKIIKSKGKREYEGCNYFTVPQIDTPMTTLKRSRTVRY